MFIKDYFFMKLKIILFSFMNLKYLEYYIYFNNIFVYLFLKWLLREFLGYNLNFLKWINEVKLSGNIVERLVDFLFFSRNSKK